MLKLLIILAMWITPGVLLFLYLLWISKRRQDGAQLQLPLTDPSSKTDPHQRNFSQSDTVMETRKKPSAIKRFG
jgi:hypothetical protein